MGVDLKGITTSKELELEHLRGRKIAVDAYNWIYQFLSIIRQYKTGEPLRDSSGRVTSHYSGIFYRTANLLGYGAKLCYIFDGEPPRLKLETTMKRKEIRKEAKKKWKRALEKGEIKKVRKYAQQASKLTDQMVEGSKELLDTMGVPWVQAPSEGEAQASFLCSKEEIWATASQDWDSLLFGSPRLVRNLNITGKRKLPGKDVYVTVKPELIELKKMLDDLEITRGQLVDIGIICGTDYNDGVKNVGPKTALKLIKKYGDIEKILEAKDYEFDVPYQKIRKIFLEPKVTEDYELEWKEPNKEKIMSFLCDKHDFSVDRVEKTADKLVKAFKSQQESLSRWA